VHAADVYAQQNQHVTIETPAQNEQPARTHHNAPDKNVYWYVNPTPYGGTHTDCQPAAGSASPVARSRTSAAPRLRPPTLVLTATRGTCFMWLHPRRAAPASPPTAQQASAQAPVRQGGHTASEQRQRSKHHFNIVIAADDFSGCIPSTSFHANYQLLPVLTSTAFEVHTIKQLRVTAGHNKFAK
jgi:hypothetical protein